MGVRRYTDERLAETVAAARGWADLMRRLGLNPSGGQRRVLQERVVAQCLDTGHFAKVSPWRKYPDTAIAAAVASSTTLREVVLKLGATPATGTLSHIRRRIAALGLDTSHFPGLNSTPVELPFTVEELRAAAASADSMRGAARRLGIPDDSRSRAALGRMLRQHGIDTGHFHSARLALPEAELRTAVAEGSSYADVLRALGFAVTQVNHRRVRNKVADLGLDTGHFTRRSWGATRVPRPRTAATAVLRVHPTGSARVNRERLHRALQELGVPYACAACGNTGEWRGRPLTLQIDHVNGDWLDNRPANLRYLCPNCHATTDTWCRKRSSGSGGITPGPRLR